MGAMRMAVGVVALSAAVALGCGGKAEERPSAGGVGSAAVAAGPAGAAPIEPAPADPAPAPVNLETGPIEEFESACARCHGPEGAFFAGRFRHAADDGELFAITATMMRGPGMLKPTEAEFQAMADYMKALERDRPFATINNGRALLTGETAAIAGAKREGTTVGVIANGQPIEVQQEGRSWTAAPGATAFVVEARAGDQATSFTYPASQWPDLLRE